MPDRRHAGLVEGSTTAARATCRRCPVAGACLNYALAERLTYSVWGGTDPDDRRAIAEARGLVWEPAPVVRRECHVREVGTAVEDDVLGLPAAGVSGADGLTESGGVASARGYV